MWEGGDLLSSSHKNELQKKVPSQHGPITVSLCIYVSVKLCWSTLCAIKSSCEENASQSQLQGEKKKKRERETHYDTFDRTGMKQPLVYPVNVTHFLKTCVSSYITPISQW